jgi:serine/threonine-protein kinase
VSRTAEDLAGRLLAGRYRLVERIDRGGTAEVWRGRDERLDRDVAVKVLGAAADPAFRERFTTEARRAAAVNHPHVVTVFDEGQDGTAAFIVMEDVRGRSLRDRVAERGAFPAAEVAALVQQIGGALDATHQAGLVHLDVKPANVIVDASGNAKLIDFGIARAARDSDERELVGTARYIAPERVEGNPVTPRSDVYGLALVAYELLTGRPAFPGVENEDLLRDRLDRGAPHIRWVDPGLSDIADRVVATGLARDPAQRYASAGAFAAALSDALDDPATIVLRPIVARSARRPPRLGGLLAHAVDLAVLVGVVLFFAKFPATLGGGPAPTPAASHPTPNVAGQDVNAAAGALIAAGYRGPIPWVIDPKATGTPCSVTSQQPAAGTPVRPGSSASLVLAPGNCAKSD